MGTCVNAHIIMVSSSYDTFVVGSAGTGEFSSFFLAAKAFFWNSSNCAEMEKKQITLIAVYFRISSSFIVL